MSGAPISFFAPAVFRRAFFLFLCVTGTAVVAAPRSSAPPPLKQLGKPNPAEGRAALEQMRRQGIAGNYFLEFQLRVMPRRGEERVLSGRLWGGRSGEGPLTRVVVTGQEGGGESRLLIQNGRNAAVWRWDAQRGVQPLGVAALFEPVMPGTDLTPFDLEMPFIYWDDFTYEGVQRYRGRPAHVLVLRPPAEFATQHAALKAVRVHLDTQYNALVQTESLGEDDRSLKTLSLLDLKKVGEQWIPKSFDLRDEVSRNKTRFTVTAAALDLDFSSVVFEPARLDENLKSPDRSRLITIEP